MKCLVTGGSGFIGSHLVDKLEERGHKVHILDIISGSDIRVAYTVNTIVSLFKPDVIFHLAGLLGTSELMDCVRLSEEVNVFGTINVLEACKMFDVPLVYVGKQNPENWVNPYTITKRATQSYCAMYSNVWGLKIAIIKPLHVYGPRQKCKPVQKYVPTFIDRALKNEPIPIWGDGKQTVDPVYVTDVAEALIRAWERKCWNHVIEVGHGKPVTVLEVAGLIRKMLKSHSLLDFLPMRPGEPLFPSQSLYANPRNQIELLDMLPDKMVQLEEGLEKTIEWWKKRKTE